MSAGSDTASVILQGMTGDMTPGYGESMTGMTTVILCHTAISEVTTFDLKLRQLIQEVSPYLVKILGNT